MGNDDSVDRQSGVRELAAVREELQAQIRELERLVLSGEATLDDYGALALAQQEWQRLLEG